MAFPCRGAHAGKVFSCQHRRSDTMRVRFFKLDSLIRNNYAYKQYITVDNSYILLYTVCVESTSKEVRTMNLIIDTYSMTPIYEQIVDAVKQMILSGELKENDVLPSVRVLSRDLKISALTVKKAYDTLEEEGLTSTVHGKGTYVSAANRSLIQEERRRELEKDLEAVYEKAERYGVRREELLKMFEIITEEQTC